MKLKRANRVLLAVGFLALIIISWALALGAKSAAEKQAGLIARAEEYLNDGIFVLAAPLLEEAAEYNAAYT